MCADYIAAGLPPDRFWQITPRLYLIEMEGASRKMSYDRGIAWDTAVMARDGVKVPKRTEYVGKSKREIPSWESQLAAWEAYAKARETQGGA
jgi:hypothetical protein